MNTHLYRLPETGALNKRFFWALLIMLAMLALRVPAQAQTSATDTSPSTKNIYRAGGDVRLSAPVRGDVYAAGGRVTIEHPVQGDATLAGGSVRVRAAIGDDLRVAGGDVHIENSVGGELYVSGGNITLGSTAEVLDAVTVYAGQATIDGKVKGPLKVYAQKIALNGEVGGNVELNAEEIEIGPKAKLSGALTYPADARFKTAEGAIIGGIITRGQSMNGRPDTHRDREWHGQMMGNRAGWADSVAGAVFSLVALLAVAALLLLVFTGFSSRAASTMLAKPWPALAAGTAVFVGTPMLAVLLCITLIGIPLGIALMMLFPLMLLIGWIVGVFGLSQRLQRAVQKYAPSESSAAMMGFFALTLLLVMLIGSLPVVGSLLVATIWLLGTGAFGLELYNHVRSGRKPPAPNAATPGSTSSTAVGGAS